MTMRATLDELEDDERDRLSSGGMDRMPERDEVGRELPDRESAAPDAEPMLLAEMDFTEEDGDEVGHATAREMAKHNVAPDAGQLQHGAGAPSAPSKPAPVQAENDEYASAIRKLEARLSAPVDHTKGYAEARDKDNSENAYNRLLDSLQFLGRDNKGMSPAATNVADFMRMRGLQQRGEATELSKMGELARLTKPKTAPAGMTDYQAALLKLREKFLGAGADQRAASATRADERFEETKRHNKQTEGAAWRAAGRAEENQVSGDAKALAEKLGDPAVFAKRYERIKQLAAENGGEIPGLGMMEGVRQQSGILGSAVRAVSPPSANAVEGRKLLRQLGQEYAHAISGAGVSNQERAQLNAATVDVDNDDSAIAMAGLESLREMYEAKAEQTKLGYRPEAIKRATGGKAPSGDVIKGGYRYFRGPNGEKLKERVSGG